MRVLVAAATRMEVSPLIAKLQFAGDTGPRATLYTLGDHHVTVLITGVGMVATAAWCSRSLATTACDLALNVGVCGAFNRALELGSAVHIVSDRMPELGAEDDDRCMTIHQLGLLDEDEFPFTGGQLVNPAPLSNPVLDRLPLARAITVNTVHGNAASIARLAEQWNPDVESMEGAAFMYSCLTHGVPFAQVRAVSNVVERRNRDRWRLAEAVRCLGERSFELLSAL